MGRCARLIFKVLRTFVWSIFKAFPFYLLQSPFDTGQSPTQGERFLMKIGEKPFVLSSAAYRRIATDEEIQRMPTNPDDPFYKAHFAADGLTNIDEACNYEQLGF
jgi:hypothetical protein